MLRITIETPTALRLAFLLSVRASNIVAYAASEERSLVGS